VSLKVWNFEQMCSQKWTLLLSVWKVTVYLARARVRSTHSLKDIYSLIGDGDTWMPRVRTARESSRRRVGKPIAVMCKVVTLLWHMPPLRAPCLTRARVLCGILRNNGYDANLVIGVRRVGEKLDGHAWVEGSDGFAIGACKKKTVYGVIYHSGTNARR